MRKSIIKLAAGAAAVLLMSTSAHAGYTLKKKVGDTDTKLTMFGFAQLEMVGGDGMALKYAKTTDVSTPVGFRAQRIRLGWKYSAGKIRGKVFMDFNQDSTLNTAADGAALPSSIKDAFISYVVDPAFVVKLGLIKTPNGMSFTMPGWNLDIAERGFDKPLSMERNIGLMISGRDIGFGNNGKVNGFEMGHERPWKGFGYDIMVGDQSSRSKAVTNTSPFGGLSYIARGMFDWGEALHTEASYALSQNAAGYVATGATSTDNLSYSNINLGVDSNLGRYSVKAEYYDASNIKGVEGYDEQVSTVTLGAFVTPAVELVMKHIQGSATKGTGATETTLGNTYLGVNLFMSMPHADFSRKSKRMRNQHKVVANYILASGDGASEGADKWSGLSGYRASAFIVQYQFKF